ncbi:nucleic acid binding [Zea mays]|uniref:Nucleic acid binding n=1 Tax=Zea mays TaxID=4577 RepID=A0A1D6HZR8_MAIZE|nr:nucleic acid binding [Zea mays]
MSREGVVRCKDATAAADELPGLLRYRSAPSMLLGEVMCGDQDFPAAAGGEGHGPPDHAATAHRQHPRALSHRAPLRGPGLKASLPRRGRSLHGRSCRLATTVAVAHVPVATAADRDRHAWLCMMLLEFGYMPESRQSYIDKFSAIGIKICIFSWVMSALSWVDVMAASCMDDERVSGEVREQEDDDDKVPQLSAAAMEALREFLAGQHRPKEQNEAGGGEDEVELVPEDWRLSQFWYDERTARELVEEVVRLVSPSGSGSVAGVMACIACLTLYAYLKKTDPGVPAQLLEYDERFGQYGCDFTFYDDNRPEELPAAMKHAYRVIVADPPYLSKECLEKVAKTVSFLARPEGSFLLLLIGNCSSWQCSVE